MDRIESSFLGGCYSQTFPGSKNPTGRIESMTKKETITPSLRDGVELNADRIRKIRWPFGVRVDFEDAFIKLMGWDASAPGATTKNILNNLVYRAGVLRLALFYGLKTDDKDLKIEDVDGIIEAFIEKGGSEDLLIERIQEAYLMSADPNGLVSWKANIMKSRKNQEIMEEAQRLQDKANEITAKASLSQAQAALKKAQELGDGQA